MASTIAMPSQSYTALGQFAAFPLEVRQEIYQHYILLCQLIHSDHNPRYHWPTPSLLHNPNQIFISLHNPSTYRQEKVTNLLCVNSTIHNEVEEIFHIRFVFLLPVKWSLEVCHSLTHKLNARAKMQISRLSFAIHFGKAPGLSGPQKHEMLGWKEGNTALAQCLTNLRTVCFEIRVPLSPVTTRLHRSMMAKCIAVARPFKEIRGVRVSWVGENLGAHIAHMCENVSGPGEAWPLNSYDTVLHSLRERIDQTDQELLAFHDSLSVG